MCIGDKMISRLFHKEKSEKVIISGDKNPPEEAAVLHVYIVNHRYDYLFGHDQKIK